MNENFWDISQKGKKEFTSSEEKRIDEIKEKLFKGETISDYERLAKKAKFIELQSAYSENLRAEFFIGPKNDLSELGRFVKEKISGEIIFDLGCGRTPNILSIAKKLSAGLYIGVDLEPDISYPVAVARNNNWNNINLEYLRKSSATPTRSVSKVELIDDEEDIKKRSQLKFKMIYDNALQITGDMLIAISQLKDDSIFVVIASGIEASGENKKETLEYIKSLEKEIERVLKPGGIVINYSSDISLSNLKKININTGLNIEVREK